ncbi:hypothetical protein BGX28_002528 [Mortierella sp. GBA30]|nr:hypothetical protein BGX28_002528 [Mortierella sp. GBA30]
MASTTTAKNPGTIAEESKIDPAPTRLKLHAPSSTVSFPMPISTKTGASPSSGSSSSSSSSAAPPSKRKYIVQSDTEEEAGVDDTHSDDGSVFICAWKGHREAEAGQQQIQQQASSRSKGKRRAVDAVPMALESCRSRYESEIDLINHYLEHLSFQGPHLECPIKSCRMILRPQEQLTNHNHRFHPELSKVQSKTTSTSTKKPPSTPRSSHSPKRKASGSKSTGSSRSETPVPVRVQLSKQRRTRMQTQGAKQDNAANGSSPSPGSKTANNARSATVRQLTRNRTEKAIKTDPDIGIVKREIDNDMALGPFFTTRGKVSTKGRPR